MRYTNLLLTIDIDIDGETHDEVYVEEEADVEHEVRGTGHNKSPHVQRPSDVQAVSDE